MKEKNKRRLRFSLIIPAMLLVMLVYAGGAAADTCSYTCTDNSGICPLNPYRLSIYTSPNFVDLGSGVYEEWLDVEFKNCLGSDAKNVTAVISCIPQGMQVIKGSVTIGDIASGACAWSQDNFIIIVDTTIANVNAGPCWDVTYYDAAGKQYVLNKIAKFCGESCKDICPTLIELSSFTAQAGNGSVTLKWATESEIDNAGFNIYRSVTENGQYTKINEMLIPAQGSAVQGASYTFTDSAVKNRTTYYYILEDVDMNGTATSHGSVKATPRLLWGIF